MVNSSEALSGSLPDDESADWYAQMWGHWAGREEEWFLRTSELVGYSPFDPLMLPAKLLTDLRRLDGRPIAQVREEIHAHSSPLDDDLLEGLYDFGVALPTAVMPTD